MFRRFLLFTIIVAAVALTVPRYMRRHRSPWSEIARGIEMRRFNTVSGGGAAHVVAFRFAPSRLHVVTGKPAEAFEWRERENALVAVNGAFFDPKMRSLGLRIADGETRVGLVPNSGSVFAVRRTKASIVAATKYRRRSRTTQAIQCSPRLVLAGLIPRLKDQWARRTAVGVRRDGRVVLAVADGAISFTDWAKLWAAPDALGCADAMSLDGGGSTQLSVKTPRAKLEISGFTKVPDAVVLR